MNKFLTCVTLIAALFCNFLIANDTDESKKNEKGAKHLGPVDIEQPVKKLAASPTIAFNVFPNSVDLSNARDRQTLVAQIQLANGVTNDVTEKAVFKIADPSIATVNNDNQIAPVGNGETVIFVTLGKFKITVPVNVTNATVDPPISFKNDVMPVFSKTGCNAGSCHGASRGKDGFQLSLYGFDPDGDYHRLTREMPGRRINLALPEDCLLTNKVTGGVSHTGGILFDRKSEYYDTLIRWLKSGGNNDAGPVPTVTAIEIYPHGGVLNGADEQQRISVRATYSDGTDRDVTSLAYFMTNNDNVGSVDQSGIVAAKNRGEAFVMARFDTHTQGVHFVVLPKDQPFEWQKVPEDHFVDQLVNAKLRKLRIQPSELCTDAEFMRRAALDICGLVPTVKELKAFVADSDPAKREKYVDQLLERDEFVEMWVMKWSELLQVRSTKQVSYKATLLYYNWLKEQISNNVPIDEMVTKLLTSKGGTFTNAATNYYQNEQDTLKVSENVAQVFLGMRIQCAQCHNHPFDRWTMDDYYGFAAFFSQVGRKPGSDPREAIVFNTRKGEMEHPVDGRVMAPKFLGGEMPDTAKKDRRRVLADWLVSKENPFFTKNLTNIVWAHFLGRGIVDEVDDVRVSNPATNPELLDELAKRFAEYDFDFKRLVRDICTSRTYQLSTQTNPTNISDERNFSHAPLRRIRAEVLLDVISQITQTDNKFRGLPRGARAVQIADGNSSTYFLSTFGRAKRETVCSCEVKMEPNLSQALHLINGDTVHNKIIAGKLIPRMKEAGQGMDEILDEIYQRCLSRLPTQAERDAIHTEWKLAKTALVDSSEKENVEATIDDFQVTFLEDIFWAVLNSREFVFNH